MKTLSIALAVAVLGSSAMADLHSRSYFVSNGPQLAYATVHVDLDDETDVATVWSDYQSFTGDVTSVVFRGTGGEFSFALNHDAAPQGFAWGSAAVGALGEAAIFAGDAELAFASTAVPGGELVVNAFFGPLTTIELPIDAGQVPGSPASAGTGSGFFVLQPDGSAFLTAGVNSLTSPVTSAEVRGPAAFGDDGALIATGTINSSTPTSAAFTVDWTAADAQALDEIEDGLAYVLVRTADHPQGEVRGQIAPTTIGDRYCPPRPNSVNFNAANIWATGSIVAADNDVTLSAVWMPPQKPVLPLVGFASGHVFNLPGSSGILCLGGGPIGRLPNHFGIVGADGTFTTPIDLTALPFGAVTAGQELNLQLWYRDHDGTGPTTNFSSALSLRFY